MRYQNLCDKKLHNASSTAPDVCSISIDCVPTETICQDQMTYSIDILYPKPVVLWEGGGKPCLKVTGTGSSGMETRIYYASNKHVGESQEAMKTAKDFPSSFKNYLIGLVIPILQNYFK